MITVLLPVRNVEEIIEECLTALQWASEVILIDGNSTDSTLKIAAQFTNVRVKQHPSPDIRICTQETEPEAKHDWILWVQADEIYTSELSAEIQEKCSQASENIHAFRVPQRLIQFGEDFGPGAKELRLWRKGKGKFAFQTIHDMPIVQGDIGILEYFYLHKNNPNLMTAIPKTLKYNLIDAKNASDEDCHRINSSFWFQLLRFNYVSIRTYFSCSVKGFGAASHAFTNGLYQLFRHLMLIEQSRVRRGKINNHTNGWKV
ncbi:MAG: glycosyltransferase [Verrucomicrobiota bacterium]